MPRYRGRVDCTISPLTADSVGVTSRDASEIFVNVVQHLSSCSDIGVEMIAANYGIVAGGQIGTGFQFWDQGNSPGQRAWAVFRFHSASMGKFDCMVFIATGSGVTYSPMNIITNASSFNVGFERGDVGISFACHPSGSNTGSADGPWNGSYSLTSASIGVSGGNPGPVWKLNDQQRGAFFPRANGVGGSFSGSRNYMSALNEAQTSGPAAVSPTRFHIICSEDSITTFCDHNSDLTYKINHFGPYLPRSGSTGQHSPYLFFTNGLGTNTAFGAFYPTTLGTLAGSLQGVDGAIAHPDLISGSRNLGIVNFSLNQAIGYTNLVNGGAFEKFPVWAAISEGLDTAILGVVKHVNQGFGMITNSVSAISGAAAFGAAGIAISKLIIPWSGSYPNTLTNVRTGRSMNFDLP